MKIEEAHLQRIFSCCIQTISEEVKSGISLTKVYPKIGAVHPAKTYERHVQHLLFAGLRQAGYYTQAESGYFEEPKRRNIDLAVWLPDLKKWFFMEIERCPTQTGYKGVIADALKLAGDKSRDPRDSLRGLLVYGFKERLKKDSDHFRRKFENLGKDLEKLRFQPIETQEVSLEEDADFPNLIAGLWLVKKLKREIRDG